MVEIPKLPRRFATTDTPKSSLTAADIQAPYAMLAKGMDAAGQALEDIAVPLAEKAGTQAVRAGDDGGLIVDRGALPIVGKAGDAFERAAKFTYLARAQPQIETELTKLRLEFPNDPEGFKTAADAFVEKQVGNVPDGLLKESVRKIASETAAQHYRTALVKADASNVDNADKAYKSRIAVLDNRLAALARQSGTDTPEYQDGLADLETIYGELAKDARFKYPQERVDRERTEMADRHKGEAIIGRAMSIYDKSTPTAAAEARKFLQTAAWDPAFNLTPSQRQQIVTHGMAALEGRTGENKASIEANKKLTAELIEGLKTDAPFDERGFNDHLARAVSLGDVESYYKLTNYRALHNWRVASKGLPIPQQYEALRGLRYGGLVERIAAAESGGNPNAQASTSSALGAGQFIKSTWLDLVRRHRPELGAGKTDEQVLDLRRDPKLSSDMIARYAGDNAQRLAAAGVRTDDASLYLAHFLGPGDAIKVLSAPADTPLHGVVADASIEANKGIFARNPTAGQLIAWAGGKMGQGVMTAGALWSAATRKEAENDFTKYLGGKVEELVVSAENALGKNRRLSDDEIGNLAEGIKITGRLDLVPRLETALAAYDTANALEGQSLSMRQAVRARLQSEAADSADPVARKVIDTAEEALQKNETAMRERPYSTGAARGLHGDPPPLLFGNPEALAAVVDRRAAMNRIHQSIDGGGPSSIFEGQEAEAFRGAVARGNAKTVSGIFAALGRLDDGQLEATLKGEVVTSGIRGALRATDPEKYTAVMSAVDALWARAPETAAKVLGDDGLHQLKTWQSLTRYLDPETLAKERARADDPQVSARRKANLDEGRKLALKMSPDQVTAAFDRSWWITPWFVARNLTGTQPLPPVDPGTRDALMGDFATIFARRYADTLDETAAATQAAEILRTKWARSPVNGGQLMLRAPETVYPAVDGSHGWLQQQIEADLTAKLGPRLGLVPGAMGVRDLEGNLWDYTIVADRQTETEAQRGQPASYVALVKDNRRATPTWDVLKREDQKELRYSWDVTPFQGKARADFAIERQRVLAPAAVPAGVP